MQPHRCFPDFSLIPSMQQLVFTVTNDLVFDQRMIRICTSLAQEGYAVTLVGRKLKTSQPLQQQPFFQKRLFCFFTKGKLFYAEYNLRLFLWLLFKKMDLVCAIDLDTILPCYFISRIKKTKRVYDAHELFCEMKEIVTRPSVYNIWKKIERYAVPKFKNGYTVNQPIADEFKKMYGVDYDVIRSIPFLQTALPVKNETPYLLYQGAVNEGRSFETLIPAMKDVKMPLRIAGDGNFLEQTKSLVNKYGLETKVTFIGKLLPEELKQVTRQAFAGITIFENNGLSNYLSLANRFFDYINAGIPQVCVNYPAYAELNKKWPVAVLIDDVQPATIAAALNKLITDENLYAALQQNCLAARKELNWTEEEKKLKTFYKRILNP